MATTIKAIIISPDGTLQRAIPLVKATKDALEVTGDELIIEVRDIYSDGEPNTANAGNVANFHNCDNNSVLQMHAGGK